MSEKAEVTTTDAGAHLIVRVKRRREDDPAETICLYDDNHNSQAPVSKRNRKSLVEEMARAVTLKGDDEETNTSTAAAPASQPRKRLILQRVSTLEKFSYATLDQDTAAALVKKRAREADSDAANDGDHPAAEGDSKRLRRVKLLVAQSKKTAALSLFVPYSPTAPAGDAATAKKTCVIVDTMQIFDPTTASSTATTAASNPTPTATSSTATTSSATKKKIVNPPTRLLAQAIVTAVTRNDFNDLSRALIQGADINHQLDASHPNAGGYTALMAAAQRGNLRVLKRLLLDSSLTTVLAKNADGRTALELLPKPTPRTAMENQEMRQLLEQATIRQHQQEALRVLEQQRQQQRVDRAFRQETSSVFSRFNNPHEAINTTTGGEDYVVDIYVVQKQSSAEETSSLSSSAAMDTTATAADGHYQSHASESAMDEDATASAESFATSLSILRVEGLKIDDETGQVELVAYDSDWSDLADDEEPDSNDERYYANDYPDESDDDNGGRLFAELDEDHHQRDDDGLGDEYRDSDESDDDVGMGSKLQRRQQRRRHRHLKSHGFASSATTAATAMQSKSKSKASFSMSMDATTADKHVTFEQPMMDADDDDGDGDAEDEEDNEEDIEMDLAKELDSFFGGSAGRGGGGGGGGGGGPDVTTLFDRQQRHSSRVLRAFDMQGTSQSHTTESLQELWDEVPADMSTSHREGERIGGMRERTGMVFAANAHEFDRETGLPKYGHELSDDDHDVIMQDLLPSRALQQSKPPRDAVAYDSELDGDHSD